MPPVEQTVVAVGRACQGYTLAPPQEDETMEETESHTSKPVEEGSPIPMEGELPTYVLPRSVVKFLNYDPEDDNAIPSDNDYFNGLLARETCRGLIYHLEESNRNQYFKINTAAITKRKSLGESMEELLQQLDTKLQATRAKMEASDRQPLVERFLDALKASPEEKKVYRFVLCVDMMPTHLFNQHKPQSSRQIAGSLPGMASSGFATPAGIAHIVDVPLPLIMQLMNPESVFVKEGLYVNNSKSYSAAGIPILYGVSRLTMSVLQGLGVTLTQYDELKSTVLQNVLLEHAPFRESDAGQKVLKRNALNDNVLPENKGKQTNALADALKDGHKSNGAGTSGTKGKRDRLFDALAITMKAEQEGAKKPKGGSEMQMDNADDFVDVGAQKEDQSKSGKEPNNEERSGEDEDEFGAYASDLAYLEDQVRANILLKKAVTLKVSIDMGDDDELFGEARGHRAHEYDYTTGLPIKKKMDENAQFQQKKELEKIEQRLSQLQKQIAAKIHASASENGKAFRLEQLCEALHLSAFEKSCILLLLQGVIVPSSSNMDCYFSVGQLIGSFCSSLEEKMKARAYFYKTSTMIEEGILTIFNTDFSNDLSACQVKLDRRLFDFLVGLDTEMSEIVDGSHLYKPDISIDDVVLPESTKKRVLDCVLNFDKVKDVIHETGMAEKISYGLGQVLLFYGASGTGKTMLANAIAAKLGVKVLLVNFPDFGTNSSGAIMKFLFREARINKALLFFDECESLFMSREKQIGGRGSVNMLLTELERFDGICVLATNRAYDLDEAMQRRISLSIEFQKPDHIMRERLWKAIMPEKLPVDENINFALLAKKYELVGGTVKNAWIQAISIMIQRGGKTVSMEDLEQSASEQVRNQLTSEDFDRRVVPTNGIDTMVLEDSLRESINSIVQYSKAQSVLFGQWGFDKIHRSHTGISVLFYGKSGVGKTMAAEAIGFDLGRPLLVVNVAELVSKWVGETGKNIASIFATAKAKDAILVFDEAEGLFGSRKSNGGSTSRHDNLNVGLLLQRIEEFSGICVMPSVAEREKIWKSILPEQCPVANDVDFAELARRYEMSGGGVKNALLRAATSAALRSEGKNELTMADLRVACDAEVGKLGSKSASMAMYS